MKENKNFKLNGHPELVSGSHEILNRAALVQNDVLFQKGRSMVEMLGVLAVMGVLSVGGIAMYTSAMNKHRANELLNEASKRAAIVAMQIASGKTGEGLSVDEFTQPSGYLFGVDKSYVSGGKTFVLTLSKDTSGNIDESICNQMIAATGSNSVMQVAPGCGTITFNADMSKGVAPASSEENTIACNGHGYKDSNDACVCVAGYSATTDCSSTLCASGETYCGDNSETPICCDNATEVCTTGGTSSGTCFKAESGCTTNANCTDPDKPWCELGYSSECTPSAGTCTELDEGTPSTEVKDGDGNIVFRAGQFLIGPEMNWYAAQNWCRAHGKELVHLSTFKISTSVNDDGWCDLPCGSSESCDYQGDYPSTGASAVCKPLGSSFIMDINDAYYGKLLGYMRAAIGSYSYWTADDYDSCNAFYVYLDGGSVYNDFNRYTDIYALCE